MKIIFPQRNHALRSWVRKLGLPEENKPAPWILTRRPDWALTVGEGFEVGDDWDGRGGGLPGSLSFSFDFYLCDVLCSSEVISFARLLTPFSLFVV